MEPVAPLTCRGCGATWRTLAAFRRSQDEAGLAGATCPRCRASAYD